MSVEEWYASECEICNCYSNSGFNLCEGCAMNFALWLHNKFLKKELTKEFVEKQYEVFKKQEEEDD